MAEMRKRRTAEIRLFCFLTSVFWPGGVAQLGERLLCKQEVIGSIPFTSTMGTSTMGTSTMGTSTMGCAAAFWRSREQPRSPCEAGVD